MKGQILSVEDANKLANYDKLKAKCTELESNNLAKDDIIKCKDKEIKLLENQIKEQNKKIEELTKDYKQTNIFEVN